MSWDGEHGDQEADKSSGAGIIGQPYAFRNAGLLSGTILLVGLTIVVDWTICLIVINSKLSGTDSFQATVQHCFGKSGLVAISLAQWLLYVGRHGCASWITDPGAVLSAA